MTEYKKAHNSKKDAFETAIILEFLLALAENDSSDYAFLKSYSDEIKKELAYIWEKRGTDCHKIADMQIGQGANPILEKNTKQGESWCINYGCDFALNLREGCIEKIAKEDCLAIEHINLIDWPVIYFEITQCINANDKAVSGTPKHARRMPKGGYNMPAPRPVGLTNKEQREDIERHIEEANSISLGSYSDESEKLWAEKIIFEDIKKKTNKLKDKLGRQAEEWAKNQKIYFSKQLEGTKKENKKFMQEHRNSGIKNPIGMILPTCPTAQDWFYNIGLGGMKQIWLLIKSSYFLEVFMPAEDLVPYIIWQAGKHGLENFAPFTRLIIATGQGFLVFDRDWYHYTIWPPQKILA